MTDFPADPAKFDKYDKEDLVKHVIKNMKEFIALQCPEIGGEETKTFEVN